MWCVILFSLSIFISLWVEFEPRPLSGPRSSSSSLPVAVLSLLELLPGPGVFVIFWKSDNDNLPFDLRLAGFDPECFLNATDVCFRWLIARLGGGLTQIHHPATKRQIAAADKSTGTRDKQNIPRVTVKQIYQ